MVYLDHAATTPMLSAVAVRMSEIQRDPLVGNPSSLHAAGRRARRIVEESREQVARAFGAHPSEVLFTSGGTESNNLAIVGLYRARRTADPARRRILVSPVEHHAVLDVVESLAMTEGAQLDWLPVDPAGRVLPESFAAALQRDPQSIALATVMTANNEIGTLTAIRELTALAAEAGVPLHTDAAQAAPVLPIDFGADGASAVSITGHKLGGPGGTGILLLRRDVALTPWLHGGGQERGLRSGTLDTAGIAGLAVAALDAHVQRADRAGRLTALREQLFDGILAALPDAVRTAGPDVGQLPGIAHLRFPGAEAETLLMLLDRAEVQCSAGAACSAGVTRASHVLLALGLDEDAARSGLRFSLGHTSTEHDVQAAIAAVPEAVARARAAARPIPAGAR